MDNESLANITCGQDGGPYNMGLHIAAIFILFACSAIGVLVPIILTHFPKLTKIQRVLFISKFFGAGVIFCTGVVHIFPEAVATLSDECLPQWFQDYPAAGLFAMLAAFAMHLIEWCALNISRKHEAETDAEDPKSEAKEPNSDEHAHSLLLQQEQKQHNISTYSLEMGIMIHSVIIGVTLGVATSEFNALLVALSFHQCFEGIGLGTMISRVNFEYYCVAYFNGIVYAITTPIGVAIGIGIRNGPSDPESSQIAIGVFESLAAGILIYSALVNLVARSYTTPQFFALPKWEKAACFLAFYMGAGCMATLAIWA